MTLPTITYVVGSQDDLGDDTDYSETENGCTGTLTVQNGTVFKVVLTGATPGDYAYYEVDVTDFSGNLYPNCLVRYMTSTSSIKVKLEVEYDDATTEIPIAWSANTDWTTASGTLADNKTVDKIRLYVGEANGTAYFDFWSFFKDTQTFHNFDELDVNPRIKKAVLGIPGCDSDVSQHLGRANTLITIEGPMRAGKDWAPDYATSSANFGRFLKELLADRYFQWFTSDVGNFKVMPAPEGFHFVQSKDSGYQVRYVLALEEYDVGDSSVFTGSAYFGK